MAKRFVINTTADITDKYNMGCLSLLQSVVCEFNLKVTIILITRRPYVEVLEVFGYARTTLTSSISAPKPAGAAISDRFSQFGNHIRPPYSARNVWSC